MGNAIRSGAGRHRLRGNALQVRRGSRRLAVRVTCQTTGHCTGLSSWERVPNEFAGKPMLAGVYVGQHLSLAGVGKACKGKPRSPTGLGKSDRPG